MFKVCRKCGQLIKVIKESGITTCCGEDMTIIKPNSVDAAREKHVPEYEIKDNKIIVTVNHVMEEEHYIEWIAIENDKVFSMIRLNLGEEAKAIFEYIEGATIYSYCNKHSLWCTRVEE